MGLGLWAACFSIALLGATPAQGAVLPSGFRDTVVFPGLEEPMAFDFAADGRVFVAEKAGKILVYEDLDDETPSVFADIRTDVYDTGDRGIMAMELDPEFPTRPYVYVLYTYDHLLGEAAPAPKWGQPNDTGDDCPKPPEVTEVDACPVSGRLVRLEAGGLGGNQMVGQLPLVEGWCQQYSSHSVGDIQFDAVGNLYASGGEGGNALTTDYGQFGWPQKNQCGDPPSGIGGTQTVPTAEGGALRSQDARTPNPTGGASDPTGLSGSMIRIDRDTGEGVPGNPMFGSLDANERRIVGIGFRNPFRFELDTEEDDLYVANVGWVDFEEIDHLAVDSVNPFNSGWPCYEGNEHQESYDGLDLNLCEGLYADEGEPDEVSSPFFSYGYDAPVHPGDPCPHEGGAAISGISVYRDDAFPAPYDGALFFADSVRSCIYAMMPDENKKPDPSQVTVFMSDGGTYPGIDIEVGPEGDLYYARIFGGEDGKGALHRISYDAGAPDATLTASPTFSAAVPLVTDLDAGGSTDPQDEDLTYDWDLDGDGSFDDVVDGPAKLDDRAIAGPAPRSVRVRVSDEGGSSSVAQVVLHPGNTPPVPDLDEPLESLEWGVGETIEFSGSASDPQDGSLEDSALHWSARLLHCPSVCHEHPLQVFPAVEDGSFVAPDHDYPAKLKLVLTVTDSQGLTATETVTLEPRTVEIDLASNPAGLTLGAGFKTEPAPFTLTAIEGGTVELSAPETQVLGGDSYNWSSWSNGGERVHSVVADAAATYTANYTPDGSPDFPLTVTKAGSGEGAVASSPAGIDCDPTCSEEVAEFPEGAVVTLSQAPAAGSKFSGWSGCEEEVAGDCKVTTDEAEAVVATFDQEPKPEEPKQPSDPSPPVLGPPAPPQTLLLARPAKRTTRSTARFRFSSDMADARFECILDRRDYAPCRSPKAYRNLRPGKHLFTVVAVSSSEVADPTPVTFRWRVLRKTR